MIKKYFFLFIVTILIFFSCQADRQESEAQPVIEEKTIEEVKLPESGEVSVIYVEGDVYYKSNETWEPLFIGDVLSLGDEVKTEEGICELQFGERAVVRLDYNTVAAVERLVSSDGAMDARMGVSEGSLMAKVEKLAGNERFKVRTPTTTCGVRGTAFRVKTDKDGKTQLAVKEGAVKVIPAPVDIDVVKDKAQIAGEELVALVDELEENAPLVMPDQEIEISPEEAKKTAEVVAKVEAVVDIEAEKKAKEDPQKKEILSSIEKQDVEVVKAATPIAPAESTSPLTTAVSKEEIKKSAAILSAVKKEINPISREHKEALQKTEEMKVYTAVKTEEQKKPVAFLLEVEPQDAEIEISDIGVISGGRFQRLFEPGTSLTININREGYASQSLDITLPQTGGKSIKVKLKKAEKPLVDILLNTTPEDATIYINNKESGRGRYSAKLEKGQKLKIRVEKQGYKTETLELNLTEDINKNIVLTPEAGQINITIKTQPEDAKIYLDNKLEATGSLSLSGKEGEKLSVKVEAEGYEPYESDIILEKGMKPSRTIVLKQASKSIRINVTPQDAKILLDNKTIGTGSAEITTNMGDELIITRAGYESPAIRTEDIAEETLNISLKPKPLISANKIPGAANMLRAMAESKGILIGVDKTGTVWATSREGKLLWSFATGNSNENILPVAAGDRVYISGPTRFVILDLFSGKPVYDKALSGKSAHIFGRHVAVSGSQAVYPESDRLIVMDAATGREKTQIELPEPSKMSPAIVDGNAYIVTERGKLLKITLSDKNISSIDTGLIQPVALSPVVKGRSMYILDRRGSMIRYDIDSNTVKWKQKITAELNTFTEPVAGKKIYVYNNRSIYAVNPDDGKVAYTLANAQSAPALAGDLVVYPSQDNKLKLCDQSTGATIAELYMADKATAAPYSRGEWIYVPAAGGKLYIYNIAYYLR